MDVLTVLLQIAFGIAVRKWPPLAGWSRRLIPVFNAALATVIQVLTALVPAAHADSLSVTVLPQAHHAHPGWAAFWVFVQPIVMSTLFSTGIFSTVKNVGGHLLKVPHDPAD